MGKSGIETVSEYLVLIGALNWGLGIWNFNLVSAISEGVNFPNLATILYGLVGLSGLWLLLKKVKIVK